MNAPPELTSDQPEFWTQRYESQTTPWDLGQPSPVLAAYLAAPPVAPPAGKQVAVVGCGNGHDAALFGQAGYTVTGFDYAPLAVANAQHRYGQFANFEAADLFTLPAIYPQAFDMVVEHTCFCAILPRRRPEYVQAVAGILKPGGQLIGVFWAHHEWGGPPYKTDVQELNTLFSARFNMAHLALSPHSVPDRSGEELLGVFIRKTD